MRLIKASALGGVLGLLAFAAGCSDASSADVAETSVAEASSADVAENSAAAEVNPVVSNVLAQSDATWYPAPDWRDTEDPVASPCAKKGGTLRFDGASSPSSFNAYVDTSSYVQMMFSLMYPVLISTDTETLDFVPSLASRWSISKDDSTFTFIIDERAYWSDGVPVTAEDVKWTFDQILDKRSDSGFWKLILGEYERAEVVDAEAARPLVVRFVKRRDEKGKVRSNWRDITHCGMFYILPKHYFEGKEFNKFDFVGAPVCGPYRIVSTEEQVQTVYARVKNWWKADFPSCRYVYNFDRIVMRYYGSKENAFHAFKKGIIDVYPVYSARIMATETFGPKFERNWILKRRVNNHEPIGFQGFAMNMRRPPFDSLEVRQAMSKLIDRERLNREMMYDEYFMQNSYFGEIYSDHPSTNGVAYGTASNVYYNYDFDGAKKLLTAAGYTYNEETKQLEKDGKQLAFTFLARESNDAYLTRFVADLKRLGVSIKIDCKDFASWMRDMDAGNFDMTWASYGGSLFREPEVLWHSSEADRKGSANRVGFKSKEVDELIEQEKALKTFAERREVYRQIDHLITELCPHAFLWNISAKRLLYWNKFGMPDTVLSRYNNESDVLAYWWYDPDRDDELKDAMSRGKYLPQVPVYVDYDTVMKERAR